MKVMHVLPCEGTAAHFSGALNISACCSVEARYVERQYLLLGRPTGLEELTAHCWLPSLNHCSCNSSNTLKCCETKGALQCSPLSFTSRSVGTRSHSPPSYLGKCFCF